MFFKPGKVISLLLLCSFLSSCTNNGDQNSQIVVIKVGTDELKNGEFAKSLSSKLRMVDLLSARDPKFVEQAKRAVIHDFLNQHIVRNWATKNQLKIEKLELEEEFQKIRSQYPDDLSFREAFADENQSVQDWLGKLKLKLLEKKVQENVTSQVETPTEKELKAHYKSGKDGFRVAEAIKLRQIVTENKLEAERIRKLIRRGKNFEELARKFSISPDAQQGGKTGWIEKSTLDVFDKAFKLGIRSTSKVLESPYGHHIIQVLKKRSARQLSYSQVKPQILKELFEDRKQATYTSWVNEQVKSLKVMIDENTLAAMKVDVKLH